MTNLNSHRPVFYDPHQRRWWRWRQGFITLAALLAVVMVVFVANVLSQPRLTSLGLPDLTRAYRPVIGELSKPGLSPKERRKRRLDRMITRLENLNKGQGAKQSQVDTSIKEFSALMIAFFVNWDATSLTSFLAHYDKIDVLVPEWLQLGDASGTLVKKHEEEKAKIVRDFIKHGQVDVKIMPLLNNFNGQVWESELLAKFLANRQARKRLIDDLIPFLKENGFIGVNVDFENIPRASQMDLHDFMQELYHALHTQNLLVSQDLPASDGEFDYGFYAAVNDFIVLMNYDQHWENSAPGPVASQDWFVSNVQDRLEKIPHDKLVIALANYGYDWGVMGRKRYSGKSITFQDAMRTAKESDASPELDPDSLNPSFEYYDENNRIHHVWFLDGVTIYNQIAQTKSVSPHGYALWRLGSEDPSAWHVLAEFETDSKVADQLRPLKYGYDVDYNGDGELLTIQNVPQAGERDLTLDPQINLVTDESFPKLPLGYLIDRRGRQKNKMALTFDDGPDPRYTPQVLDILKEYKAPATFFLVGLEAESNIGIVRRMVEEGHEIGNHTFTHPNIGDISTRQLGIELNLTQRLFQSKLGRESLFFRPPYGVDSEPEVPAEVQPLEVVQKMGYLLVGERPDSNDWFIRDPDEIVKTVIEQASHGNVLLLHDAGGDREATVLALPRIITELRKNGYELVGLSALLGRTRDAVMPLVTSNEQWRARLDNVAFTLFSVLDHAFHWLFLVGIVFGIGRFIFIGTLAIIQEILRHREKFNENFTPFVSVIVPAHNEEKVIVRTIAALLRSDYPRFDVIVVDDGSTDATADRVSEAFGRDARVRLFVQENSGKAGALNSGLEQSVSEIIIALDADTLFDRDTMRKLVRHFEEKEVGAVAGNTKVGNRVNLLTRWQALEYVTSQNLDRRAFDALNCITVVPGAVGAWRRDLIQEVGGFTNDTLAEDTDLTISIRRLGYDIVYEDEALAYTEAPDTIRNFIKQRFRWTYGTMQSVWKHRDTFLRRRYGSLGWVALPNIVTFQILFPLISPLMDFLMIVAIVIAGLQHHYHGTSYSATNLLRIALFYAIFLAVDYLTCVLAFILEWKEDWKLLVWLFWQRLLYRQVMYYIAAKSLFAALRGRSVAWGKVERKATIPMGR
jgi:cellulose synthase/poly-beta-1,6-N-acetylglucosamine synthase-like glycosyltransferase/peptidoglycan/xylan/chitin deacetylase (PgdA/CDA1 family)/spore germination protein YaaH